MNEELDFIIQLSKEKMEESLTHLDKSMINIRAGKANPNMLNSIKLDYYGTLTPLSQVANIKDAAAETKNSHAYRFISTQPYNLLRFMNFALAVALAASQFSILFGE